MGLEDDQIEILKLHGFKLDMESDKYILENFGSHMKDLRLFKDGNWMLVEEGVSTIHGEGETPFHAIISYINSLKLSINFLEHLILKPNGDIDENHLFE